MAVRFNPTGSLDIASDPAELPEDTSTVLTPNKANTSGAMTRCTNLDLDRAGIARTRRGSAKINATAISTDIFRIIEQAGVRYSFAGKSIYKNEVSIGTDFTESPWSGVLYNSYATTVQSVFALNGTDRKRITDSEIFEWGSESPTEPPILGIGGNSGLTGDYNAKYTWVRKEGSTVVWESNPSPAADSAVTLSDQSLTITCAIPTDTQITHIRIYRTLTSGAVYYYDKDIAINVNLTEYDYAYMYDWESKYVAGNLYQMFIQDKGNNGIVTYSWESPLNITGVDTELKSMFPWELSIHGIMFDTSTADNALGIEASWIDHLRPPLGTIVVGPNYSGIVFIIKDNLLYYCLPNQPEYWPETYYIEVSPIQYPIKAAAFLSGQLYVATAVEIYAISGSGPGTFFPLPVTAQTGAVNADTLLGITGYGLFHLGNDGIHQFVSGKDQLISRGQFEPLFRGETRGSIPGMNRTHIDNCWLTTYHGKLYFGYPGGNSVFPDNILVMDLATNRMVHYQYPASFRTIGIDYYNSWMLAGDSEGYIWQWENVTLTDDNGTDILWQIQSKDFSQYYKYFPRYAKYDVNVNGGSATGYIILDDTIRQTHAITGNRLTRNRLVAAVTGDRLAVRLAGSGGVLIYGVEIQ